MYALTPAAFGISAADKILAIVPMFHAMAWGLPYAALFSGADMHMPDRFLQPEPLCKFISPEKPTVGGAVPTVWNGDAHLPRRAASRRSRSTPCATSRSVARPARRP